MHSDGQLCFLIIDGEHARLVRPDINHELHTVNSFDSVSAHRASHEIASDRPGRSFESATTTRHAIGPQQDPHDLEKLKFANFVADVVSRAADGGAFNRLVLVAPSHCLQEIEGSLEARTAAMVIGRLAKDLVKLPDHDLSSHLRKWVPPPRRAS